MALLILMRHGQSNWNLLDLFTGWVDVPLSKKGIEEAMVAGQSIAHLPVDIAFTSTLIRAHLTLFLALEQHESKKVPVIVHEEEGNTGDWSKIYSEEAVANTIPVYRAWQLNERMYGQLQGKNKQQMREMYGEEQVHIWRRSYDVAPPEGESLKMTKERTLPYFKERVVPHLQAGKNVLLAAHGNSLRSIIMELDGLSEEEITSLEIPTGKPLFYQFNQGAYQKKEVADVL